MTEISGEKTKYPLTWAGLAYMKHLKTFLPKMYKELQESGQLEKHVYEKQESIYEQMGQMVADGIDIYQAKELVQDQIFIQAEPGQENNLLEIDPAEFE